ncbi:heme-binding protein, partial [Nocardia farcinica]|uniref:heme-binding protein n=1 Tax=Nocardia farcinica TaxID=37329 RepID=UPI002455D4CA
MRIRSAVAELPARVVTNDDIVGWIGEHSAGHFEGDLDAALRKVDYYLRYAGSRERRWLDAGERPIDLLRRAANTALDRAEVRPEDVDLLIYTGIGRGFIEPGGAYHSAAALGLRNAHCFDILDVPGGVFVRADSGTLLGAVGVTGAATSAEDELAAIAGIRAAGLVPET